MSPTPRSTWRLRLRNWTNGTRAHEERFDDFRRRPVQRTTAGKPLLAQRILTREPQHHPRRWSVDRGYYRLEARDFLRNPPSPARLSVSCREGAAFGVVHWPFGSSWLPIRAKTGPESRVPSESIPTRDLVGSRLNSHDRQILARVALGKADFGLYDV